MKFFINSKEFSAIADRVMSISVKNPALPIINGVTISADPNKVAFSMNTITEYVQVTTDSVSVEEPGEVVVHVDELKKLFSVKGEWIKIEGDSTNIKAASERKRSEVHAINRDEKREIPEIRTKSASMCMGKDDLLKTVADLSKCLSDDVASPMMCSFHFCNDRVEALNGYMIGIRSVDWHTSDQNVDAVIPGVIHKTLKKIINKAETAEINLYLNDRWAKFTGSDFIYIIKLTEGKFFDTEKLYKDYSANWEFVVDADELENVAKEYEKLNKSASSAKPMLWHIAEGRFTTLLFLPDYKTYDQIDIIDSVSLPEEFTIGLKPNFVADVLSILHGEVNISILGDAKPVHITQNDYKFIVLPVNIRGSKDIKRIKPFLA